MPISAYAIEECSKTMENNTIPCILITTLPVDNCGSISFYDTTGFIETRTLSDYGSLCSTVFNFTSPDIYLFNASNNQTGMIEVYDNIYENDVFKESDIIDSDKFDTSKPSGMFMYAIFIIILIGMIVFTEYLKIPASAYITGLLILVFGIILFSTLSYLLGSGVVLIGLAYMIRGAFI